MENEIRSEKTSPQKPRPEIQTQRMSVARKVKIGIGAVIGILVILLIFFNRHSVEVSLIFTEVHTPLFLMVPFVFLLGMVIGYIMRRR